MPNRFRKVKQKNLRLLVNIAENANLVQTCPLTLVDAVQGCAVLKVTHLSLGSN